MSNGDVNLREIKQTRVDVSNCLLPRTLEEGNLTLARNRQVPYSRQLPPPGCTRAFWVGLFGDKFGFVTRNALPRNPTPLSHLRRTVFNTNVNIFFHHTVWVTKCSGYWRAFLAFYRSILFNVHSCYPRGGIQLHLIHFDGFDYCSWTDNDASEVDILGHFGKIRRTWDWSIWTVFPVISDYFHP